MADEGTTKLAQPVNDADHMRGRRDAPVVFVEYGDLECPYCRQANSIVRELRELLGDRFLYVFRHFPIGGTHPHAGRAAEATEAAAAQGKFWEMQEKVFQNQDALTEADLLRYAAELDLDLERFRSELQAGVYRERVQEDFLSGVRSGINGTPTFFINGLRYDGPWDIASLKAEIERPLGVQIRNTFQQFARLQASGGILLFAATLLALALANSPLRHTFLGFWETLFSFNAGAFTLSEDLLHWVNDGLMVIFFFVVGLEIKRELLVGELSSLRQAALPLMAAIGGILLPAALYLAFNAGTPFERGWAVPMATDIAFTLGMLTLLGGRVPLGLKVFFTAMAIVDDIGAVLVIAIFYSQGVVWGALGAGGLILLLLIGLNRLGVRSPLPYGLLGIGLWLAFLESGVHPTIAGVLLAFTIPASTGQLREAFQAQCISVLGSFEERAPEKELAALSNRQQVAAQTLEAIAERIQNPAQRLQRSLSPWSAYLVLPVFALANAGVSLGGNAGDGGSNALMFGIFMGLTVGKPVGIGIFSWLAVRLGIAELPSRVSWPQLFSASTLAGIGFTMSLFIAGAAFDPGPALNSAKLSILLASLVSGGIGFALLILTTHLRDRVSRLREAEAAAL
jgi:NhaA family Na+:H+ antiporter